jgi:hypothetical protein
VEISDANIVIKITYSSAGDRLSAAISGKKVGKG